MVDVTRNLEALLAAGRDDKTLRFALASRYHSAGELGKALAHAEAALGHDPDYSAAWKLLGRILTDRASLTEAAMAYRKGIAAAERQGDKQAAKEMRVFLKRIERDASKE